MTRKQEIAIEVDQLKQQLREREIMKWMILIVFPKKAKYPALSFSAKPIIQ